MQEERAVEHHDGDGSGGCAEQQGLPPGSTKQLVRVGACPSRLHGRGPEARRAATTITQPYPRCRTWVPSRVMLPYGRSIRNRAWVIRQVMKPTTEPPSDNP